MAASFLRSVRRISYNYSIFLGKWTATGSGSYPRGAPHMNLSTTSETVSSSPSKISKNSSPWLMLPPPPASEGGVMSFKFYSLAENKVLTLTGSEEKELTSDLMPNRRFRFRGSSLGWLALLNPHNLDLFLYNPISRRHIKLPPIRDLPNFPKHRQRDVTKVILSCSPDEDNENCRAVIIYNCINSLAFCCPGHSEKWTPFGEMRMWWDGVGRRILSRGCRDCVYSTRQNVFFCLTNFGELESWDLQDPSSPRVLNIKIREIGHFNFVGKHQCINLREMRPKELGRPVKHLVVADQDLLLVTQYIMEHVGPDGSYVDCLDVGSRKCPYRTVCFDVHKYDLVKGFLDHMMPNYSTLAGWVLFIGFHSHSVALPAAQFPELNPDSIYFTDTVRTETLSNCDDDQPFGGHDIGIFDFEDKTVSSCYYPCDVGSLKRIMPPPMWFLPSLGSVD